MIKKFRIQHFKSVRNIEVKTKKINLFIGFPNSGKSNILEALGLFSASYVRNLKDYIRFKKTENLFFDNDITHPVIVEADDYRCKLQFDKGIFRGKSSEKEDVFFEFRLNHGGEFDRQGQDKGQAFKYYSFRLDYSSAKEYDTLMPPFGKNLFAILYTNKELRKQVSKILLEKGFRLIIDTHEQQISVLKEVDDVFYTYPYESLSDTIQRVIFFISAISTNSNSALLFEEPEAYTFPFYIRYLAEQIAGDNGNQYFIVTHNPYFFRSMLDNTTAKDIAVHLTYMEDYETKVKTLTAADLKKAKEIGADFFLRLNEFLPEK